MRQCADAVHDPVARIDPGGGECLLVVCPCGTLDRLCQLMLLCTQSSIAVQGFAAAQAGRDTGQVGTDALGKWL
jgi:hypothetical protein